MEMPKPGPGHKKLELLVGDWSGEEKMHPSPWCPQGGVATGKSSSRAICDGFYVAGDYEQRIGGAVTFRGHSVVGFDERTGEVAMHWFDSMGMGVDVFRGKFEGSRLTLQCQNPNGHHRLTYDFSEKGTLRNRMESSQDGVTWNAMFDAVYHRKG